MPVKLEWLGYRMVKKLWQYVKPFSSGSGALRTDRRTELLYQYRALVCWRAIKIIRLSWNFVHSCRFLTGWASHDQKWKSRIGKTPSSTKRISCYYYYYYYYYTLHDAVRRTDRQTLHDGISRAMHSVARKTAPKLLVRQERDREGMRGGEEQK